MYSSKFPTDKVQVQILFANRQREPFKRIVSGYCTDILPRHNYLASIFHLGFNIRSNPMF